MGIRKNPANVKLIMGLLGENPEILKTVRDILSSRFGPEEEVMEPIPFKWTRFYSEELGEDPWRSFVSYENLFPRETLVEIKIFTNEMELEFGREGRGEGARRRINVDPGYLTLGQLFLASTKDQRQRVYIRDGIYVEPTLFFQDGAFHPFPWTYRDYQSPEYREYFLKARSKLAYQKRHGERPYSKRNAASRDDASDED